jgi:hypothetical protein
MIVRIKTRDDEIHVFKSTDALECLEHRKFDPELHALRLKTSDAEYCFPLENVLWVKMTDKEM